MNTKKALRILIVFLIVISNICCDRISKNLAREKLEYNTQINIISNYVILTKIENTGAFLGLGNSISRPAFIFLMILLPLTVIGYAIVYLVRKDTLSVFLLIGISLLIGGGLGNIYDRILYGSVTDFLYFDFVLFHTGIVNLADIFVTTGFFVILYGYYVNKKNPGSRTIIKTL
jgi:signal peptidase II